MELYLTIEDGRGKVNVESEVTMTYPTLIKFFWFLLTVVLAAFLWFDLGLAGGFIEGSAGVTYFLDTLADKNYKQRGEGYTIDSVDPSFRVRAGYDWSNGWGVRLGAYALGSTRTRTNFVNDADYDGKVNHACMSNCGNKYEMKRSDSMHLYEIVAAYTWNYGAWHPYVELGPALVTHRATVQYRPLWTPNASPGSFGEYGRFLAAVVHGGVCYQAGSIVSLCGDAMYYHSPGPENCNECGWPSAKAGLSMFGGVRIGLP